MVRNSSSDDLGLVPVAPSPPRPLNQAWNREAGSPISSMTTNGHSMAEQDLEAYGSGPGQPVARPGDLGGTTGDESRSCWASCSACCTGLWATRQLANSKDREIYVKTTLRELVVYIFFLVILCLITFGMTSTAMYYMNQAMTNLFLQQPLQSNPSATFETISSVDDVWDFLETILASLYPDTYYNTAPMKDIDKNILYENKLLGVPRLRQLRVRNDSCEVPEEFKRAITSCYDGYSPHIEDKEPFGLFNGTAWVYQSEEELDGSAHWGQLATYSGAGSYEDLGVSASEASERIAELRDNLWITRGTRAVFLDFTVYNANINLFCVTKLVMEFPATGGVMPSWSLRVVKLIRYVTPFDYFILACEIIFCVFIVYYIVEEILEIKKVKCPYFTSVWNLLDIAVIMISIVCIAFSVYRTISVDRLLDDLLTNPYEYPDFEVLGFFQTQYNNAVAVAIFFAWIKIFKYISFNKTMTQLSSTLSKCSKDVAGFAIMFFIVFFAFAQLGYLLFGTQVEGFSNFGNSVFTLLRIILGDFDFHAIEQANRILGPIFFITYVFFVFFVLLNMFLAIINDTYSVVKAEIALQKNEFEIGDYFLRGYNNLMGKVGRRDKIIDIETAIKLADSNSDGEMSFDEIRKHLKKRNFSDMEIEMFFSKYDKNQDRSLDSKESKKMLAELAGEKKQLDKEIDSNKNANAGMQNIGNNINVPPAVSREEFIVLSRRVDRMENSIGSIISKIDAVLVKMESMEKSKVKRRETMNKILNTITEDDGTDDAQKRVKMERMVREELERWDSNISLPK